MKADSIFEGLIGLAVVVGSGFLYLHDPNSVGFIGVPLGAVIGFYFGQRATITATNGAQTAMFQTATSINNARNQISASEVAARAATAPTETAP